MAAEPTKDPVYAGSDNDQPTKDLTPSTEEAHSSSEGGERVQNVSKFARVYRSPLFNVIIVGLISFTQPGIWNALNSMFPPMPLNGCDADILKTRAQAASRSRTSSTAPTA